MNPPASVDALPASAGSAQGTCAIASGDGYVTSPTIDHGLTNVAVTEPSCTLNVALASGASCTGSAGFNLHRCLVDADYGSIAAATASVSPAGAATVGPVDVEEGSPAFAGAYDLPVTFYVSVTSNSNAPFTVSVSYTELTQDIDPTDHTVCLVHTVHGGITIGTFN